MKHLEKSILKNNSVKYPLIVAIFIFLETAFLFFYKGVFGPFINPFLLFFFSLASGIALMYFSVKGYHEDRGKSIVTSFKQKALMWSTASIGIIVFIMLAEPVFSKYIISVYKLKYSDIIPQVSILVKRLLSAEFPYKLITVWGWGLFPTYMPLQWLPFSFAELLSVDYRWVVITGFSSSILIFSRNIINSNINILNKYFLLILPALLCYVIIDVNDRIIGVTIEFLIASYYLILGLTLYNRSNLLIAIGILLCLLSRYSLVLWLPLYFMIMLIDSKKRTLIISLYVISGVLLIYILPFFIHDTSIFIQGYEYHTRAAIGEWKKNYHIFKGIGFASFFYEYIEGELTYRIDILKTAHISISLLGTFIMSIIFYAYRKVINKRLFLLASLKIYLVIFYSFIQIPYQYLFIVPFFISILILFEVMKLNFTTNDKSIISE